MAKVRQDVLFIAQFQRNGLWLKIGRPVLTLASHIKKKAPPQIFGEGAVDSSQNPYTSNGFKTINIILR